MRTLRLRYKRKTAKRRQKKRNLNKSCYKKRTSYYRMKGG